MIRGLYTSAWSMKANNRMMDVISNNLANVNTTAFKKDTVVFESFPNLLTMRINDMSRQSSGSENIGDMQLGSDVGEIFTYYKQGQMVQTENNLDLSIKNSDNAFFTIAFPNADTTGTGDGTTSEYYTRDGAFELNTNNNLVTKEGYLVLGENGPITLTGSDFRIEKDGSIIQDGQLVDRLLIRQFQDTTTLRKAGNNLVTATDNTDIQDFTGEVAQGYIEQSNVNVIREMVDMISVMRAYEANQKVLQTHDNLLEKAVSEVGAL